MQDPFEILGHTVSIGVSIGIAFASADAAESERLVHRADLALYSAKRLGGGRHVRYSETLEGSYSKSCESGPVGSAPNSGQSLAWDGPRPRLGAQPKANREPPTSAFGAEADVLIAVAEGRV